jgi:hypothetical protein
LANNLTIESISDEIPEISKEALNTIPKIDHIDAKNIFYHSGLVHKITSILQFR